MPLPLECSAVSEARCPCTMLEPDSSDHLHQHDKTVRLETHKPPCQHDLLLSPEQKRWDYKSISSFNTGFSTSKANLSETTLLYSPLRKGCLASRSLLLRSLSFLHGYVLNFTQTQGVLIAGGLLIPAEGRIQTLELYYLLNDTS